MPTLKVEVERRVLSTLKWYFTMSLDPSSGRYTTLHALIESHTKEATYELETRKTASTKEG